MHFNLIFIPCFLESKFLRVQVFRISEILKSKKENKNPELSNSEIFYLIKFSSYLTRFFYFHFFIVKFPSYEKLAMTSQFDLTRFYDFITRNSFF